MTRALMIIILTVATALSCAAAWQGTYECDALPSYPIDSTSEVTHLSPDDLREITDIGSGNFAFHIVDTSKNRSRYRIDLDPMEAAGTIETRQRFVSSSDMNNIAVLMRQDTPGASAEIRVGYCDTIGGLEGLWDTKSGLFLGPTDPNEYYKLRMVLDGVSGGRLYVNDSYFADLTAGTGASSRLAFGSGSTLGTGEVFIDYFRWSRDVKAGPGDAGDPADPGELVSPRIMTLPDADADMTSVTLTWSTDEPSDSTVRWGTDWSFANSTSDASLVTEHSVTINGLSSGATYRFYVESRIPDDSDIARSGVRSFTTEDTFRISSGPFVETASNGASAIIGWTTTLPSDSRLFFRLKGEQTWQERYNSAQITSHALTASDLAPNSAYEFYVVSSAAGHPDAQSAVSEFFTYIHSTSGSLLENGGFELGNLIGWSFPTGGDFGAVHQGPWLGQIMPHSGDFLLGAESFGGARNSTVYQSIADIPQSDFIYATAWIRTYELSASGVEEHNSANCRIGIDVVQDPAGSINIDASTIRWSAPMFTANAGPWTCIGVKVPRNGSTFATVFLRHVQTADGGTNATCFDDVSLTLSAPLAITSGPTVTSISATSVTIEWTTDAASTTFVQYGTGTLGSYQFTNNYLDSSPTTAHSVTIPVSVVTGYVFQVGSASPLGLALSEPIAVTTPLNDTILNGGFEDTTIAPWTIFQYDINQIPRFFDPSDQPAGEPIDGLVGPYPNGGATWHGITCEPDGGSYFIGAYSDGSNKNGGVYQRVAATPGQIYKAKMRFLTQGNANTTCAIAIDPTGGTNVLSSSLVWSFDRTSSINGQWDEVSVMTKATASIITVFCVIEQRYTDSVHLCALDNVTLEQSQPVSGHPVVLRQQHPGTPVTIGPRVLTYADIPSTFGEPAKLYVEEANRSAGIGIISTDPILWGSTPPAPGDSITATGVMAVVSGEAVITDAAIVHTAGSPSDIPKPLFMTHNRLLCGSSGILQPGMTDGMGISAIGLLVKIAGKVTSSTWSPFPPFSGWITDQFGRSCAYIDDGSGLQGHLYPGIKFIADSSAPAERPFAKGDTVVVTGVSSIEEIDGVRYPVVLVGDWQSIIIIADC